MSAHAPPVRWGMIGVGSVAEHKSGPAYQLAEGSALVAVAARRPAAAQDYARRHGVARAYAHAQELIQAPEVDAVYIATPPESHAMWALQVAQAGKPCCVEKPLTVRYAEAADLVQRFAAAAVPLFVAYYRRCLPRFLQLQAGLAAGRIGRIEHVSWTLARLPATPAGAGWRTEVAHAPGGLFEDLACHGLDLLDALLGPVTAVQAAHAAFTRDDAVPTRIEAQWRHGSDIEASGSWDFAAVQRQDRLRICGTEGKLECAVFDEAPLCWRRGREVESCHIDHPTPIQLPHVQAMIRHLRGGAPHPSTGSSALRTAWLTETVLDQAGVYAREAR